MVTVFLARAFISPQKLPFYIADVNYVIMLQINEKGQLRLSRRALLPEPSPAKQNTKQRVGNPSKDTTATQKTDEKGMKMTSSSPENDVEVENIELLEDRGLDVKFSVSDNNKAVEAGTPEVVDKFVKRFINSGKDATGTNKIRPKRNSNKPVINTSKTSDSPTVNGEAKVG